ncbi:MAG: glycine/betaine ABC transporter substrate-binding protein [gamma proteobacterium symbiont of Ctena orbiculata]|uniref:Glycine betaine ABC transporter substrate-binding protein n=1 Tax=Candidatus Thiodiazotropha taylori TaxID=2792791 RepID=A0A944M7G9_9GAMM|nr:glycine betaine ABC transporter substrate-binding protein [Candidatus Thiodiazotropha taylori]MBV2137641.1 glycine betaine ABC transporter substrate-binding protein [Candidatus Thiodiazotropha taylori]PVV13115.1 MAG: glycine/betaine ABC transporter substrate-binding protein [gamma proteobacterium symbiont of Ctena orbiculata]PVV13996.1 MAG: glycine/betaine ABC transporter substrate-binding protein [gamma proteobacterium symbiont of Ctena orbiculata]PVV23621.1 MAG: glycine/betaine ABC transpo
MKNWLRLCLVVLVISTAHAADKIPLRIGWTAWSDAEAVTRLAARILESRLDQPVDLMLLDIGIQYQGLANGDIDAMLMAWLPLTHKPYMDKVGDQLVNLGPLYTRARLGWVVPDYIPKDQLNSIEDLRDRKVMRKLSNQIHGIDPGAGLMQASENAIEDYGLDRYRLISSSGAGMTAALTRAIKRQKWIVVTGWSPHWMFSRWKLRYLEDPQGSLGGRERIHALVRKGFYQDFPVEVTEFLTRLYLPLDELETLMDRANDISYDEAVDEYISNHPRRVDYWVSGKLDP